MTDEGVRAAAETWRTTDEAFFAKERERLIELFKKNKDEPYFTMEIHGATPADVYVPNVLRGLHDDLKNKRIFMCMVPNEVIIFAREEHVCQKATDDYQAGKLLKNWKKLLVVN